MSQKNLYWALFIGAVMVGFLVLVGRTSLGDSKIFISMVFALLALFFVGAIFVIPILYKKKLDERGNRSLRGYMLADPKFRDMLVSKPNSQTGKAAPAAAPPKGEPNQTPQDQTKQPPDK